MVFLGNTQPTAADDLAAHGGGPDTISEVCIDMSPAFIKGIAENLPNAGITFDKFHAVKIINDAVEQVRRTEQKTQSLLRGFGAYGNGPTFAHES